LIILGGGVSQAGELLLAPLREQITSMLTFQPVPRIVISSLGTYAGMIGAGVLASRITNK
jgi:glucokinase